MASVATNGPLPIATATGLETRVPPMTVRQPAFHSTHSTNTAAISEVVRRAPPDRRLDRSGRRRQRARGTPPPMIRAPIPCGQDPAETLLTCGSRGSRSSTLCASSSLSCGCRAASVLATMVPTGRPSRQSTVRWNKVRRANPSSPAPRQRHGDAGRTRSPTPPSRRPRRRRRRVERDQLPAAAR